MINLLQNAETTDSPPPKEEEADDSVIDLTRVEQALVDRAVAESLEVSSTPNASFVLSILLWSYLMFLSGPLNHSLKLF